MSERTLSALAAMFVCASCASTRAIEVNTETDPGKAAEIASYRTYAWAEQPPGTDPNLYPPGVQKNVQDAVNHLLAERGYRLVGPNESPDFKLGWHAAIDTRLKQSAVDVHYGYYRGPWGVGVSQPIVQEYSVGTLLLDVADGSSNQLVWRGVANGQIERDVDDQEKRQRIYTAAKKILERFPPKPE